MTEEEQIIMAMIEQGIIPLDQFQAAANQYGQGSDYLGLEDTPVSWDRAADMDDLIGDMLKRTGLYFEDLVPLPYEPVEDPGQYTGYEDYDSILSEGNVAIDTVREAMATDGLSFDEAVNLVVEAASSTDPADADIRQQLLSSLPQTEDGEIDRDSFRSFAADAVSGGAQEGSERAAYDAEKAAYDDYVRARTGLDINPIVARERELAEGFAPGMRGRQMGDGQFDDVETNRMLRLADGVDPSVGRGGGSMQLNEDNRFRNQAGAYGPQVKSTPNAQTERRRVPVRADKQRNSKGQTGSDIAFEQNKSYNSGYNRAMEATLKARQAQQVASKQDVNRAKLIAAYNQMIYGGNA